MRWKRIREFPNYEISNRGHVYSIPRPKTKGGILQPDLPFGYPRVGLYNEDGYTKICIHILVITHFKRKPKIKEKVVCIHKDRNRQNNKVSNLKWVTVSEMIRLGYDIGERFSCIEGGEQHPRAKLTEFDVKQIRN